MEIFLRLFLGHFIADFTLQTNYIAAWKRKNLAGLLVHCLIHPIVYVALLWRYLPQTWLSIGPINLSGWACVFIIFATHFIEDEWRIWSVLKRNAPDNTFFYIWDQLVHYAMIFSFSPTIDGSVGKFGIFQFPPISGVVPLGQLSSGSIWDHFLTVTRPEPWVWVAIILALLTHFLTVTIYFLEKDLWNKDFPCDLEKYTTILERLAICGLFLLPWYAWAAVPLCWAARWWILKQRGIFLSWMNIIAGTGCAIFSGLLINWVI